MKLVALSDTHGHHSKVTVSDGDVLIFAGDLMTCGFKYGDFDRFVQWFMNQPHNYKILVSGNHDRYIQMYRGDCISEFKNRGILYLEDTGCEINGIKFWGSPYTPYFNNWAFDYQPGKGYTHWTKIPEDTDVLITHGPPLGILDSMGALYENGKFSEAHLGCGELAKTVDRVRPKVHIFGHIHNGFGVKKTSYTNFHNVAICNEAYQPVNHPHQIYIER